MFPFPIRHRPHSTPPTLQNRQVWQPSGGLWGQAAFTPWRPSGTGATPSIHPAQEVHTAPDTASATASTNNDDGVTPFPVFRALPREVKETFHRIMEAMSTTTCDFLQTASPSQLPEDALQRIAVQAGTTIPHPLLPEGSDFGINEACPAAEGTATSVPNTVAPASSGMEPSRNGDHSDYPERRRRRLARRRHSRGGGVARDLRSLGRGRARGISGEHHRSPHSTQRRGAGVLS
ncbi:hypothetical protein CF336_g4648 [Tilletia laevis]|nr:hypothetical protein CF336_g4648 [Tilletia laevis]